MKFTLKESLSTIYYTLYPSWDGSGEVEWEYEPTFDDEKRFANSLMKTYSRDTLEQIIKDSLGEVFSEDYNELSVEE